MQILTTASGKRRVSPPFKTLIGMITLLLLAVLLHIPTGALAEEPVVFQEQEVIRLVNEEREKVDAAIPQENLETMPGAQSRALELAKRLSRAQSEGAQWKTVFGEFGNKAVQWDVYHTEDDAMPVVAVGEWVKNRSFYLGLGTETQDEIWGAEEGRQTALAGPVL